MNTKILIMSIALILMFPQTTSVGASFQKPNFHIQNQAHINIPPGSKEPHDKASDITFDWTYNDFVHHSHNNDDENKTHHFHYDRLLKNKNRILLGILIKLLLVITHLSSILYATLHLMH